MVNFTITDKQISSIHNAMCSLYWLDRTVSEMFKEDSDMVKRASEVRRYLEPVRDELMKIKDDHENEINRMADLYKKEFKFKYTRWSIYDINSFLDTSNVPAGAILEAPWDSKRSVTVEGHGGKVKWLELWKAVEVLADMTEDEDGRKGFGNHVFIENFSPVKGKENTYEVWLGS